MEKHLNSLSLQLLFWCYFQREISDAVAAKHTTVFTSQSLDLIKKKLTAAAGNKVNESGGTITNNECAIKPKQ